MRKRLAGLMLAVVLYAAGLAWMAPVPADTSSTLPAPVVQVLDLTFPYPPGMGGDEQRYKLLRRIKGRLIREQNAEVIRLGANTPEMDDWMSEDFWPLHFRLNHDLLELEAAHPGYITEGAPDYVDPDASYADDSWDPKIDSGALRDAALILLGRCNSGGPIGE